MEDRSVQFPQRYQLKKVDGTDDIYDVTPAPGTITAEGTPINKKTLLQDATAALFKLSGDTALPDKVFEILSKAAIVGEDGGLATPGGQGLSQVKVVVGTYAGDGQAQKSLTFGGEVQLIVVNGESAYGRPTMVAPKGSKYCTMGGPNNIIYINAALTWSGKTVSFQKGSLAQEDAYMNSNGQTYYYLAILL